MSGFTLASGQSSTTVSVVCPVCTTRQELTSAEVARARTARGVLLFPLPFCSVAHAIDPEFLQRRRRLITARMKELARCYSQ